MVKYGTTRIGSQRYICPEGHTYTKNPQKSGPKPKGDRPLTNTERSQKYRERQKVQKIESGIEQLVKDAEKAGFTVTRDIYSIYIKKDNLGIRLFNDGRSYKLSTPNFPVTGIQSARKALEL